MADLKLPLVSDDILAKRLLPRPGADQASTSSAHLDPGIERTGNVWTATGHIITAVIGSGVLSLAWCMAQLGWILGVIATIMFSAITCYASTLLADCYRTDDSVYRTDDSVYRKRNPTYTKAVRRILGKKQAWFCGMVQYMIMYGATIGYTITAALSMKAIYRSFLSQSKDDGTVAPFSSYFFMVIFGAVEMVLSQLRNFNRLWWLSIVAAVMSFSYATIGLSLSALQVADNGEVKGSLWGASSKALGGPIEKVLHMFRALGDITFAFSYSVVLIEIQDTLKSPPAENITMKKASCLGGSITTFFYILCSCLGYAAFGDDAPGNLLSSSKLHGPRWLVNLANACILVHLFGAYQVFSQPIFVLLETWLFDRIYDGKSIKNDHGLNVPWHGTLHIKLFKITIRIVFVISTTALAVMFPFFNDILGLIGATNFWPMTVHFPVEMFIVNAKIKKWTKKWIFLRILSLGCLLVSLVAIVGAIDGFVDGFTSRKTNGK